MGIWCKVAVFCFLLYNTFIHNLYALADVENKNWAARIEKAIVYNIEKKAYLDAWRLTQLAKRLRLSIPSLNYYSALSARFAGACPLGFQLIDSPRKSLLYANAYRFFDQFNSSQYPMDDPVGDVSHSYLGPNRTFHLSDITKAQVIKGMGCRVVKSRLEIREEAVFHEFRLLKEWLIYYDSNSVVSPRGSDEVRLRLLELAVSFDDVELVNKLIEPYKSYTTNDWLAIQAPENRFIWEKLREVKFFQSYPLKADHPYVGYIKAMILNSQDEDAVYWLGSVDYDAWPVDTQLQLVDHLLAIENIKMRNYLLHHKAWLLFYKNKMLQSLEIVRELTLEGGAEGVEEIMLSVVDLTSEIFSEYRFDEKMLGAIQSSLPFEYWGRVVQRILIASALAGDSKSFSVFKKIVDKRRLSSVSLNKMQLSFLNALAGRNTKEINRIVLSWKNKKSRSGEVIQMAEMMVGNIFHMPEEQQKKIKPYMLQMAALLKSYLFNRSESEQKHIEEMIAIFDSEGSLAWSKGSRTVRSGSVKMGVVDLSRRHTINHPYPWKAPKNLPLRQLLLIPLGGNPSKWVIQ